jgi:hypothetical protein
MAAHFQLAQRLKQKWNKNGLLRLYKQRTDFLLTCGKQILKKVLIVIPLYLKKKEWFS